MPSLPTYAGDPEDLTSRGRVEGLFRDGVVEEGERGRPLRDAARAKPVPLGHGRQGEAVDVALGIAPVLKRMNHTIIQEGRRESHSQLRPGGCPRPGGRFKRLGLEFTP